MLIRNINANVARFEAEWHQREFNLRLAWETTSGVSVGATLGEAVGREVLCCIRGFAGVKDARALGCTEIKVWDVYGGLQAPVWVTLDVQKAVPCRLWRCRECHSSGVAVWRNLRWVVRSVVELPNGRVACGYGDGNIRVWDVVTATLLVTLIGHGRTLDSLVVLADGRLAAVGRDAIVSVWDAMVDGPSLVLNPFRDVFVELVHSSLVVFGDGRLAIGSGSHTEGAVCVWDFGLKRSVAELNGHRGCVCYLADLGSGRVVSGSQNDVVVWEVANENKLVVYTAGVGLQVNCLAVLEDEQLVTGGSDGVVMVWNLGTVQYNLGEITIL